MSRIVVIGSGIAGLFAALRLDEAGHDVVIITKQRPKDSSTNWAQGGIAGILDKTDGEGKDAHISDTLAAGDGLCDETVVRLVVEEAGDRIRDLLNAGVQFEKDGEEFHFVKEGGHTARRILHAKDATGAEIERALTEAVSKSDKITMRSHTLGVDLIQRQHGNPSKGIKGIWCLCLDSGEMEAISADAVLIATGGCGQLWERTTNPSVATGDGLAMAVRAGASSKDMAFFQFHPTALMSDNKKPFLITEALRGEGGVILDEEGLKRWEIECEQILTMGLEPPRPDEYSFTLDFSNLGSMATRDIVARAIDFEMKRLGCDHVLLDISHRPAEDVKRHFPTIYQRCLSFGIDITTTPIPIVPAAHYTCGGIMTDLAGRTDVNGLYAVGESTYTGLHGANRMASNSLLECLVFARAAAEEIASSARPGTTFLDIPSWDASQVTSSEEDVLIAHNWDELRRLMWNYVGIVRSDARLIRAQRRVKLLQREIDEHYQRHFVTRDLIELRNLAQVADLIIASALRRKESRGLHYTTDYPETMSEAIDTVLAPTNYA